MKHKPRDSKHKPRDLALGIDLGGTKILAAVSDGRGRVRGRAKRPTRSGRDDGIEAVVRRMARAAREAMRRAGASSRRIVAVGVAAPGAVDAAAGIVHLAPNLPGFEEVPLAALLAAELGLPVGLENDGNAGTLAEHRLGAGRGAQDVVGVFVGTGVGGGLVLGGALRRGHRQAAGEIGHMVVETGGPRCGCGRRGCVEAIASRTAVVAALREAVAAGRESSLARLIASDAAGRNRLRSGAISRAYRAGDPLAVEVLERAQHALGIVAGSLVNLLDPEVVVFGGGLIEALGPRFLAGIRRVAREHTLLGHRKRMARIAAAALGDDAVALGAALAALEAA